MIESDWNPDSDILPDHDARKVSEVFVVVLVKKLSLNSFIFELIRNFVLVKLGFEVLH